MILDLIDLCNPAGVNGLVGGCSCAAGYHGVIIATPTLPYYTGSCAAAATVRPAQPPASVDCPVDYATEHMFFDIGAVGAKLLDPSTPESAQFALPFGFPWYGDSETTITVGVDGLITFGAAPQPTSSVSEPLPCAGACEGTDYGDDDGTTRGVDGVLAPFWADLDLGESGAVYVQAFVDSVVVQWDTVTYRDTVPILRLRIPDRSTHSCEGDYMATVETTSQGSTVYRQVGRASDEQPRYVYWRKPETHLARWICDLNTDPASYIGYVHSSTEASVPFRTGRLDCDFRIDSELENYVISLNLIRESKLACPVLSPACRSSVLSSQPC